MPAGCQRGVGALLWLRAPVRHAVPPPPPSTTFPHPHSSHPTCPLPTHAAELVKIVKVLGTDDLYSYLDKYELELDPHIEGLIGG